MATKAQWKEWDKKIIQWMMEHTPEYKKQYIEASNDPEGMRIDPTQVVGSLNLNKEQITILDKFIADAISVVGNPYNLEPGELDDRALSLCHDGY